MTRGVWLKALALGLGGWLGGSAAWGQHAVWRPVTRPAAPAPVVRAASPGTIELGQPIARVSHSVPAPAGPRPLPAVFRTAPEVPAPAVPGGVEPIAVVAQPGSIIAATARFAAPARGAAPEAPPPVPVAEEGLDRWQDQLFAVDRREPPGGGIQRVAFNERQLIEGRPGIISWTNTWPVTPAAPVATPVAAPVAPPAEPLLYGGNLPPPRWYVTGEYLLWWTKGDQAPPLVTTGDAQGGNNFNAGFLGRPDTIVLSDGRLDRDPRHGGRFFAGLFLDDCGSKAIEVGGFFLGNSSSQFAASSAQFPVLVRPFFAVDQGAENGQFVSFPGNSVGRVVVDAPSELWGLEANLNCKVCCGCDYRVNLLGGFRFLRLRESLTITEDIQNLPGGPDPFNGTHVLVQDRFATSNEFYGGQVGALSRWQRGRVTVDGWGKVALGVTHQTVDISGFQAFPPGTPNVQNRPGGLLALDSNIGRSTRDRFAVVPEVGVSVGYFLTERLRASVGYNFLYWSSVVRPGDQIDRGIDRNRIPNFPVNNPLPDVVPPRPARLFNDTDFWAQGLTFGLEYRY